MPPSATTCVEDDGPPISHPEVDVRPGAVEPIRVAITFDDLPGNGLAMAQIAEALARHDVPPSYGFINGVQLERHPEGEATLTGWLEAGHKLGNHTYRHPHMDEVGVEAFIEDIEANEPLLERLTGESGPDASWRYFRYPFLKQGFDAASTAAVRAHLLEDPYTIAEVTIDFGDWAYNPAYGRCEAKRDDVAIAALERRFLSSAVEFLAWNEAAVREAYGRPVPHVLLLHSGSFDGVMIEDLLTAYEKRGVEWITLEEALADPAYREHEPPAKSHGDSMIEQTIQTEGVAHPPWMSQALVLLDVVCR